jgi:hypothetical protein
MKGAGSMMPPLGLLDLVQTLVGLLSVVPLYPAQPRPVIHWADLTSWFTRKRAVLNSDAANVAFTLLHHGWPRPVSDTMLRTQPDAAPVPVIVVQGVFNQRRAKLLTVRVLEGQRVDREIHAAHAQNELVLYP